MLAKTLCCGILSSMSRKNAVFIILSLFLAGALPFFSSAHENDLPYGKPPRPFPRENPLHYNGKNMPRREGIFAAIGVKTEPLPDALVAVSVYFNDAVDTNSIQGREIFIDDKFLPPTTEFLFSKSRRMMRFVVRPSAETFSLRILRAASFDGRPMRPLDLAGVSAGTFFKITREERKWQKFLL